MQALTTKMLLIYLTCLVSLIGAATTANAIENGRPDTAYHNVGALGFDVDGPGGFPPFGICSGFVISDRAFVTAAHCITAAQAFAQSWAVTLEAGSPENPIINPGVLKDFNVFDFPILVEVESTTTVQIHPWFDPATNEYDVAVLEFPAGTFEVAPVRLAKFQYLHWLRHLKILNRIPVGMVGYGANQDLGDLGVFIPGYRIRGFSAIGDVSHTRLTLEPTPVLDANVLSGDSGSPQFVLGRAVSLTSAVDLQRLDIPGVRRFLAQFTHR